MPDANDSDQPDDTMRGRVPESRAKLWLLLDANRWLVAAIALSGVFVSLVVLGALDPAPLRKAVSNTDPIETLFQAFVTAIITGVTLVVTINQLVLSQELGAVGDQRDRMEEAMQFRYDVEETLESPISPPDPASFLRAIIDVTRTRAEALTEAVSDDRDDHLREQIDQYVEGLVANAEEASDQLEGAEFGTFEMLFAALDFNYSWKIYEARRLRNEHEDALTEETDRAIEEMIESLKLFGPAREHFKTLYFQWELINLSRALLYAAVPALVVTSAMILYVDNASTIQGMTLGVDNLVWTVSAATVVALLPFMLLLSYILRIATVAKRTLAIGPFVLRDIDRSGDIDWE